MAEHALKQTKKITYCSGYVWCDRHIAVVIPVFLLPHVAFFFANWKKVSITLKKTY